MASSEETVYENPSQTATLPKASYVENEKIVNQALKAAMANANSDDAINSFLTCIGEQINCERVYVFEPNGDEFFRNSYEWCAEGVDPQIGFLQNIPREEMNVWLDVFSSGDCIFIEDVDAIAETNPVVYRWVKPQGIKSLLAFPLFGGRAILGVDNPAPDFVKQTSSLIEIMVHFVELLIQQRDLNQELSINRLQSQQVGRMGAGVQYRLNLITGALTLDDAGLKEAGYDCPSTTFSQLKELADAHPEFSRHVMDEGIERAIQTKQNVCVEFLSYRRDRTVRWNRLTITPFLGSDGRALQLYGVLQDRSDTHRIVQRYNSYASTLPGGLHICYLSDPIHLHYASDELCDFLGYTRDELESVTNGIYANLIVEQDREAFASFVERLAAAPGMESCEYRMMRKDGTEVAVVDTMESIESSGGIMYGYAYVLEKTQLQALLDIADERGRHQLEIIGQQYDVLMALSRDYRAVVRVWLDEDKAQVVEPWNSAILSRVAKCLDDEEADSNGDGDIAHPMLQAGMLDGADSKASEYLPYRRCCVQYVQNYVHPDDREMVLNAMYPNTVREALVKNAEYGFMYRAMADGQMSFYQVECFPLSDGESDKGLRFVAAFKNVDKVIQAKEAMKFAYIDAMTNVMNRNAFERDFGLIDAAGQAGFIFCDANGLKEVNDRLGHASGDALLVRFAALLKERFSADCIYRIGGDEFVCMVGGVDKDSFLARAQELVEAVAEDENLAAVGFAHGDSANKQALLQEAEESMYAMKTTRRS